MATYKVLVSYTGAFLVDADSQEEAMETARQLDPNDCELDAPEFLSVFCVSRDVEDISSDDYIEEEE